MAEARQHEGSSETNVVHDVALELYALPREEFVGARSAAARRLSADGDRDAAKRVKSLAKPTIVAWALNQAVREHPALTEELMATIAQLQQPRASDSLRPLAERHDALVHELASAADHHAGGGRVSDFAAAIRSASLSADAQRFVDGCLAQTPRPDDDALMAALAAGAALGTRPRRAAPPVDSTPTPQPAEHEQTAAQLEAERQAEQQRHRRQLRGALTQAREAQRDAKAAEGDARRELRRAERELEHARTRFEGAQLAVARADTRVEELRGELDELGS